MTEILLVDRIEGVAQGTFSARCHAGSLRVGDRLTCAVGPDGVSCTIDIHCVEIRLNERLLVDELELNYGGLVILDGVGVEKLGRDWTLS